MISTGENLIKKPNSYARDPKDQHRWQENTAIGNTTTYNNTNNIHCYDPLCNSTQITYDFKRDELSCKTCGLVLKQAYNDYETIIKTTIPPEELGTIPINSHRNHNYLQELIEIQEYKKRLKL